MALSAPAEMNDRVVVPDPGQRFDHLGGRVPLEFVHQTLPGLGIAAHAHGDRGQPTHGRRRVGQTVAEPAAADPGPHRKRKRRLPHRDVLVHQKRSR